MSICGIISNSVKMQGVFQLIEAVAKTEATVLLTGETGTGKELIARAIHSLSNRAEKPFVAINCGAIPKELVERELFGHDRGAFTGAHQDAMGKFEFANNGTVFLDEVATLPLNQQVKLLRVLQEQSFERLGSNYTVKVNVRFIAAANVDLSNEVKKKTFREDLYYRLNVVPIEVPPLRERKEDIAMLATYFLNEFGEKYGKRIKGISNDAVNILMRYLWPGNVRELQNLMESLVVLKRDEAQIVKADLPDCFLDSDLSGTDYEKAFSEFERKYIQMILQYTKGNITKAADRMGVHRNTLSQKIKVLKLDQ